MPGNTESDATLISINFWERMGKLKLSETKSDDSFIKMLNCFEGTFETNDRFEIIPIMVLKCESHVLVIIDVLKVDITIKCEVGKNWYRNIKMVQSEQGKVTLLHLISQTAYSHSTFLVILNNSPRNFGVCSLGGTNFLLRKLD